MKQPLLSIIILSWNTASTTLKCVKSILSNLTGLNYEIILVDNASSDDTIKVISKLKSPLVNIIENKVNLGFSRGNNIGAKQARGEYLFFLNSDMLFLDNSLTKMLNYYLTNPRVGILGPKLLNSDMSSQASAFPPQTAVNAFREFFLKQNAYSKYLPDTNKPLPVWSVSGGAMLIKKTLFDQINGWNEKYFFYFEDLDLCRKIRQLKKQIIYFPDCQIIHYHGLSGKNITSPSQQWRRLIPSSKIYHGLINHHLINFIIWSGQKFHQICPFSNDLK